MSHPLEGNPLSIEAAGEALGRAMLADKNTKEGRFVIQQTWNAVERSIKQEIAANRHTPDAVLAMHDALVVSQVRGVQNAERDRRAAGINVQMPIPNLIPISS